MKSLQEATNFILNDECMRYVNAKGETTRQGMKIFNRFFGDKKINNKTEEYLILKKWLLEQIENTNLFYVPKLEISEDVKKENIAPPFKNCWFELNPAVDVVLEKEHKKACEFFGETLSLNLKGTLLLKGFGLFEVQPNRYIFVFNTILFEKDIEKNIDLGGVQSVEIQPFDIENPYMAKGQEILIKAVFSVLNRFDRSKITYVSNDKGFQERGRIERDFVKIKYKPSDVIYLSGIRELKKSNPEIIHRIISKPAYAYEVMGHWRKVDEKTIGKDREGKREVHGYTWVIPHTRGEGELFKKTRILKGE